MKEFGFGQHLIMDAYGCNRAKLEEISFVYNFLDNFPEEIDMTKIMPPYVFRYQGKVPEDWGLSGVVLIAESHISIHTFPEKEYLSLDIFSCKAFDTEMAINYTKDLFEMKKYEHKILDRGAEFPKNIKLATEIIKLDRRELIHS